MNLSSSFDHRFVDGYDAAAMIQALKECLEHPATIFIGPTAGDAPATAATHACATRRQWDHAWRRVSGVWRLRTACCTAGVLRRWRRRRQRRRRRRHAAAASPRCTQVQVSQAVDARRQLRRRARRPGHSIPTPPSSRRWSSIRPTALESGRRLAAEPLVERRLAGRRTRRLLRRRQRPGRQSSAAFSRCTGGGERQRRRLRARRADVVAAPPPRTASSTRCPCPSRGAALAAGLHRAACWWRSRPTAASPGALPVALIRDGQQFFDDKGSITADPTDSQLRLRGLGPAHRAETAGPSYFAVTRRCRRHLGGGAQHLRSRVPATRHRQPDRGAAGRRAARCLHRARHRCGCGRPRPCAASYARSTTARPGRRRSRSPQLEPVGTVDPRTGQAGARRRRHCLGRRRSGGGVVYVAWQDSRFSAGAHDGIALTYSSDGGTTWSAPVQVNADTTVQAFTPTVIREASGAHRRDLLRPAQRCTIAAVRLAARRLPGW